MRPSRHGPLLLSTAITAYDKYPCRCLLRVFCSDNETVLAFGMFSSQNKVIRTHNGRCYARTSGIFKNFFLCRSSNVRVPFTRISVFVSKSSTTMTMTIDDIVCFVKTPPFTVVECRMCVGVGGGTNKTHADVPVSEKRGIEPVSHDGTPFDFPVF